MSKTRTIGIIRDWPRHPPERQRKAIEKAGAEVVYSIPDECATWRDAVRLVRRGDTVLVELIQLLPEPKSRAVTHPAMDGRDAIEEIERRGGCVVETATNRSTSDQKQRRELISDMAKSVGAGGRSLSSEQARANGALAGSKRGRPKTEFTPEQIAAAKTVWESRKITSWGEAAEMLPPGFSVYRARKMFGPRGDKRQVEARVSPKFVYFARAGRGKRVKIGTTVNVSGRMTGLAHPLVGKLNVLAIIDGGFDVENQMHRRFAEYRIKGEWFRLEGTLAAFIAKLPKPAKK